MTKSSNAEARYKVGDKVRITVGANADRIGTVRRVHRDSCVVSIHKELMYASSELERLQ